MSTPNLNSFKLRNPFTDSESSSTELANDDAKTSGSGGEKRGRHPSSDNAVPDKPAKPAMVQRPRAGTWTAVSPSTATARQWPSTDAARSYNLNPDGSIRVDHDSSSSEGNGGLGRDGSFNLNSEMPPWMDSAPSLPLPDGGSASRPTWTPRSPRPLTTANHPLTTTTTTTASVITTTSTAAITTTTTTSTTSTTSTTRVTSNATSPGEHLQKPEGARSGSKAGHPAIPTLKLPSASGKDAAESPKSSRTSPAQKHSSNLLAMDASRLRELGRIQKDMRLPEFDQVGALHIAKSDLLAAQLIIASSKWFKSELTDAAANAMLRSGVMMKDSCTDEQDRKDQNVIEMFLSPFIRHYVKKSSIPQFLSEIKAKYEATVADKVVTMHRKYSDDNKASTTKVTSFNDLPEVKALMDPLINPLIDALKGEAKDKATGEAHGEFESWMYSVYPAPILNLAIHLSAWTRKWGEASATPNPELIEKAQVNAVKAIVATRSFMAPFALEVKQTLQKTESDKRSDLEADAGWEDYYTPLLNYMNSSVTKTMEALINKVLSASDAEKRRIQNFADIAESRVVRNDEKATVTLDDAVAKVKARKPKKITTRLRDALSPRGKDEAPASPRKPIRRADTLNAKAPSSGAEKPTISITEEAGASSVFTEDTAREANKLRKRKAKLDSYVQALRVDVFNGKIDAKSFTEWGTIIRGFSKTIAEYRREDYNSFIAQRDKVFLDYLENFKTSLSYKNEVPSDGLWTLIRFLRQRVEPQGS